MQPHANNNIISIVCASFLDSEFGDIKFSIYLIKIIKKKRHVLICMYIKSALNMLNQAIYRIKQITTVKAISRQQ